MNIFPFHVRIDIETRAPILHPPLPTISATKP